MRGHLRYRCLNVLLAVLLVLSLAPGAVGAAPPAPTPSLTPTPTATPTFTPSPTATVASTPTPSATLTPSLTGTSTPTPTPIPLATTTPSHMATPIAAASPVVELEATGGTIELAAQGKLLVPPGALAGRARCSYHFSSWRGEGGLARYHPLAAPIHISAAQQPGGMPLTRLNQPVTLQLSLDQPSLPKAALQRPQLRVLTSSGWEVAQSTYDPQAATIALAISDLPVTVALVDGSQEPDPEGWDPLDPAAVQLPDASWGVAYSDGSNVLYRRTLPNMGPEYWLDPVTVESSADAPALVQLGSTLAAFYRKTVGTVKQVFVRTSTDYGATWSAASQLSSETVNVYQTQATLDQDTVYVFWSLSDSSRQLKYRSSTDLSAWAAEALVGQPIGPVQLQTAPRFDVKRLSSGDWALIWNDVSTVEDWPGAANNYSFPVAWFASSPDLSATNWANKHEATWPFGDRFSRGISLAEDGSGRLYLSYAVDRNWDAYLYYRTSDDRGATWSERVLYGYEPSRGTDGWSCVGAANSYLASDDGGAVWAFWDQYAMSYCGADAYGAQLFYRQLPAGPITPIPPAKETLSQLGNVCWSCYRADPVSTTTGNFTLPETDIAIPGRGLGLAFTRTYNSGSLQEGPLGYGWTHNYDARLAAFAGGQVLIVDGSGRNDLYTPAAGGGYTAPPGRFSTLVHNQDGTWTLTERNQFKQTFSAQGKLTALADRNDNAVSLGYDQDGQLTSVTDPGGRTLTLTYAAGRLSGLSDALGRNVAFGYSPAGDLITVTDARGKDWTYTYDDAHRLLTKVDPNGHTVLINVYGTLGRVKSQLDARNAETKFNYGTGSTAVIDPRGNTTGYTFDTQYRVTAITDNNGKLINQYWDSANNLTRLRDRRKAVETNTYFTYDAYGNVLTRQNALNNVWTYTYNSFNDVLTARDPLNHTTTYGYDARGNLTSVTNAKNELTTFGRDAYGQLTSVTDARNKTTTFGYDAYGNQTTLTDSYDKTWTSTYDLGGRKTGVTDPLGHTTSFTYDPAGNLLTATDGRDKTTAYAYDDAGNRTTVTDPNQKVTTYAYDEKNRLVSVTDAADGVTTYAYDANDNLLSLTDANDHTRAWTYEKMNRVQTETDALGKVTSYEYDGVGNRTKRIDPAGVATTYTYDAINRLTAVSFPGGSIVYAYNAANLRTSMTDAAGTTTYAYDELDRLTSVTQPGNRVVGYQYDAAGNRTRITYPDNKVVDYTYDDANRLSTVTDWLTMVTSYAYDDAGRLVGTTLPNGVEETLAYNNANQLTNIGAVRGGTTLTSFAYTLDDAGIRTAVQDLSGTESYTYDDLYRLTGATYADNASQTYTYDGVGNRLGLSGVRYEQGQPVPFSHTYTYDEADRLTQGAGATYTYDDNGNQTSRAQGGETTHYCWDALNRLLEARGDGDCSLVLRVNAGGGNYIDTAGNQWLPDQGYSGGSVGSTAAAIAGTDDDPLYRASRYGSFGYAFSVPNGEYTVTLKFAETYFSSAGRRVFNVAAEGVTALQDFDPFAAAGGKNIAVDRTFVVTVNDGVLNLQFSSVVDNPEVRGIQVVRTVAAPQASYRYRGDGLRGSKTEGGSTATYTWDLNAGLPVVLQDGANTYVYGLSLISQTDSAGNQTYLLGDGLGSTRALTDASGNVVATYGYDVFGAVRSSTGTGGTEYRFTGQQDDATLGYTYLRARYYDQTTGRFISRDPFPGSRTDPASLHPYAYAHNSPAMLTDPNGKCDAACMAQFARVGGPLVLGGAAVAGGWAVVIFGGVALVAVGGKYLWDQYHTPRDEVSAQSGGACAGELADYVVGFDYKNVDGRKIRTYRGREHGLHGHIVDGPDAGKKVDPLTGRIFDDQGHTYGKIGKKHLGKWQKEMVDNGELPADAVPGTGATDGGGGGEIR